MEGSRFDHEDEEDHTTITAAAATTTTTTTNDHSSVLSGDDEAAAEEEEEEEYVPSPKKSRKGANKKRVEVPIGNGSSRSRGEVYPIPPQDSWSWRKYGQKPIKGSPYPRGYYRCSSSKGCPARKQVERSRLNTTTLLITYAGDHNHPLPATTKNHHHHHNQHPNVSAAVTISTPPPSSTTNTTHLANFPPEECAAFANQQDIEPDKNGFTELAGKFGWLCDVGPTFMDVGPTYAYTDVEVLMPIGEEDKLLFGDLGDLPESSLVFRRHALETPCCSASG